MSIILQSFIPYILVSTVEYQQLFPGGRSLGCAVAHKVELVLFWVWSESFNQESSIIMELINF